MIDGRFDELVSGYLEGELTDDELEEIAGLVRARPELQQSFLKLTGVHGLLRAEFVPERLRHELVRRTSMCLVSPEQEQRTAREILARIEKGGGDDGGGRSRGAWRRRFRAGRLRRHGGLMLKLLPGISAVAASVLVLLYAGTQDETRPPESEVPAKCAAAPARPREVAAVEESPVAPGLKDEVSRPRGSETRGPALAGAADAPDAHGTHAAPREEPPGPPLGARAAQRAVSQDGAVSREEPRPSRYHVGPGLRSRHAETAGPRTGGSPRAAQRAAPESSIGCVAALEGAVECARGTSGRWFKAKVGTPLKGGDRIRAKLSRARIELESGTAIYVNHWTTLALDTWQTTPWSRPGLTVAAGEVYAEVPGANAGFFMETPHGRAVDLGTRFGVLVGPAGTTVVVAEGRAMASTEKGSAEVQAGQEVLLARRTSPPGPVREAQPRRFAWTVLLKGAVSAKGLLALYTFTEGRGQVARDVSCPEDGLDLVIGEPSAVEWVPGGGLLLRKPTVLLSRRPARKIVDACRRTNELTVEALVRPLDVTQGSVPKTGPARIVSLSRDPAVRDFTLGQWGPAFVVRLRTSRTDANGCGGSERLGRACLFGSDAGSAAVRLTHVVMTYDRTGTARLYIDGALVAGHAVQGDFSPWEHFRLAVGAEADGSRYWLGELRRVAVYSRALAAEEIRRAFLSAGGDRKR